MSLSRGPLFVLHAVFATVLIIALVAHLHEREQEVGRIKAIAEQEREETKRLVQDIDQQQALLDGLNKKDPYVVELIARDKLQFAGVKEISPPPLPTIDKPRISGSK